MECAYNREIEEVVIDSIIVHHDQTRVQTKANQDKRDNLERPHDS